MDSEEYFTVKARLNINVEALATSESLPNLANFQQEIPPAFIIANQCNQLDNQWQQEISTQKEILSDIDPFLRIQNEKINLLLGLLLTEQDNEKYRFFSESFSATGLSFLADSYFEKGKLVRLKIFLVHPSTAIYCYAHVWNCEQKDNKYHTHLRFSLLQEDDRDILIRAALFYQQLWLRKRALSRQQDNQ